MNYRVALITGAGSGIGAQLARLLALEGVAIAAIDIRPEGLQALASEMTTQQRRFAWTLGDVTQPAELSEKVAALQAQLGPIDLLVASAGIGIETSGLNYRAQDMNAVLNVNLLGVSNSVAAVLPGMLERRSGHIVAMSSLASMMGMPRMLGDRASKAGVNALLEGLRFEVKSRGVSVTTVCPGWIRTPMTQPHVGHLPMMDVESACRRILKAIKRRERVVTFPPSLVWQMRLLKWSPAAVREWLIGRFMHALEPRPGARDSAADLRI